VSLFGKEKLARTWSDLTQVDKPPPAPDQDLESNWFFKRARLTSLSQMVRIMPG